MAGKQLFLQFAGVNQVADVYINGVRLGQHQGGYSRFRFNATSAFKVGADNVIAVKVNNALNNDVAPLLADYTFDGGIYRNVTLQALNPLSLRMLDYAGPGVYLRQRSLTSSSATVDVTTKVFNNDNVSRSVAVRAVVTDAAKNLVADVTSPAHSVAAGGEYDLTQTVTIAGPHRWTGSPTRTCTRPPPRSGTPRPTPTPNRSACAPIRSTRTTGSCSTASTSTCTV